MGAEGGEEVTLDASEQASEPPRAPPQPGVSFAAMARDGFAATGPPLASQAAADPLPGGGPAVGVPAAAVASKGVWGARPAAAAAPAWGAGVAGGPPAQDAAAQQLAGLQVGSSSGKGGKGKKISLFGASQRKY